MIAIARIALAWPYVPNRLNDDDNDDKTVSYNICGLVVQLFHEHTSSLSVAWWRNG